MCARDQLPAAAAAEVPHHRSGGVGTALLQGASGDQLAEGSGWQHRLRQGHRHRTFESRP